MIQNGPALLLLFKYYRSLRDFAPLVKGSLTEYTRVHREAQYAPPTTGKLRKPTVKKPSSSTITGLKGNRRSKTHIHGDTSGQSLGYAGMWINGVGASKT